MQKKGARARLAYPVQVISSQSRSLPPVIVTTSSPPAHSGRDPRWTAGRSGLLRSRVHPFLTALPSFGVLWADNFSPSLSLPFLAFPVSLRFAVGGSIVSLHRDGWPAAGPAARLRERRGVPRSAGQDKNGPHVCCVCRCANVRTERL